MSVLVNGHELFCLCGNKKEMDSQFYAVTHKIDYPFL